jgi:PBP4 family serine-type D-alanyl-D-alanine carboxypeptidase
LSAILALLNKPSDNLIAETLLKTLGAELKGQGSCSAGGEIETEFLKNAGLDIAALRIVDGSGLSRLDGISPGNLVKLLKHMYKHSDYQVYLDSLPIAGVDGTLRNRMKGTAAERNVRAKSGYVSSVSTLSGYVTTKGGDYLTFSIMMNNHLCKNSAATAVQNRICEYLAGLE